MDTFRRTSQIQTSDSGTGELPPDVSHRAGRTSLLESSTAWARAIDKSYSLDSFDLGRTIGVGRYARVRTAKVKDNHSLPVCLKILKKSNMKELDQVQHVIAEKQVLATIQNPFVIQLLTTFQDDSRLYMVLELINGGELFHELRKAKRFTLDRAKFYNMEVVSAVSYLHSLLIAYRDLKPENILLHRTGHIKLTDFGFAKYLKGQRTYTVCGTAAYMAPEIVMRQGHGLAVDWWAVGILMYEMLSGNVPFDDKGADYDEKVVFAAIVNGNPSYPPAWSIDKNYRSVQDYLKRLIMVDPIRRMGCREAVEAFGKTKHVKDHALFKGVNWNDVAQGVITPPFRPNTNDSDTDISCFQQFEESDAAARASAVDDDEVYADWETRNSFEDEARQKAADLVREFEGRRSQRASAHGGDRGPPGLTAPPAEDITGVAGAAEGPGAQGEAQEPGARAEKQPAVKEVCDAKVAGSGACCAVQ
ncbi:unnamed protein product [Prorocentrum cordatum]|uniref:cGMP-dependent protein kinase n=1 Tax=Prorocentrum cordatum TaxID=2364126 RepID=A0ABN9RWP1_9DINO|nr:unnamed protein product [Polarella glacialis]|mmetsp:Transcript_25124/g.67121  ORF Transcript_25124/g.67121 Transcript_25124/m.67121 type:complete len:475 (-) Transcript_25124:352-1776(-)